MNELVPTQADVRRNVVEYQLATEQKKPEIHSEMRHGLEITVYYLRELGQVSMSLLFAGRKREFIIPNEQVNEAIAHPELYAWEAGLPRPRETLSND